VFENCSKWQNETKKGQILKGPHGPLTCNMHNKNLLAPMDFKFELLKDVSNCSMDIKQKYIYLLSKCAIYVWKSSNDQKNGKNDHFGPNKFEQKFFAILVEYKVGMLHIKFESCWAIY